MPQQQSPWLEAAYGWNYGENGWNTGMDSNLLKFSVLFDRNVDSIVATLPAAVNGQVHYNTADNRLYFAVNTTYFSTVVPKWFTIIERSTGNAWQYNGTTLVTIPDSNSLDARLDAVEFTLSSLGGAAFEDVSAFATQAELDIIEGQAQTYTDALRQDLTNQTDPSKGAALIGYEGVTVAETLDDLIASLGNVDTQSVDTLAALRLVVSGELVITNGYHTFGDGGHGAYYFDSTDTTSADNGITIIVGASGRRWKLLHNGSVMLEQAGGRADGVTPVNAELYSAISLPEVREVRLGAGPYLLNAAVPVVFPVGGTLTGIPGAGSQIKISGAGIPLCLRSLCTVSGITFDCATQTSGYVFSLGTSLSGIEYVNVRDIITYHTKGFMTDENHPSNVATNVRINSISNRATKGNGFLFRDVFAFLEMRDVAVDYIGNVAAQNFTGYSISNNEGCLLDNCEMTGTTGIVAGTTASQIGFNFTNCKAIYMRRSFADACGGRGFVFNNCQYIRLSLCSTSLCDDAGVAFLSSSDIQSTNLYVGGRRGITGATAGIPGVLINACTRVQLGVTEAVNATGDGILTAATSTQVVINGGILSSNGGRGIVTGVGSVCLATGVLTASNVGGNYSLATGLDHLVSSQLSSGALANITGPGAG